MRLDFHRAGDDFGRGQADAVIADRHAAIAGTGSDLLRPIGMAVEPGLGHNQAQRTTKPRAGFSDLGAQMRELHDLERGSGGE